ncbi:histidine phosphatase family protein [uncultured Erythrobacter sp.]|uniref:SixA phosphatase family protein n=1 Tax=uncultured Erythrobacter sp. TaxID=263913 RepID=UPI0026226A3A|nr:histidine phosphatase family protein [uncultured Erythrobacter sp.]
MPKLLGILRHAKSDWSDGATRDFDRGLNDRGRRGAEVIGDHIREDGQAWQKVVASPAERVKATFETGLPEVQVTYDDRLYLASPDTIFDVVQDHASQSDEEPNAILISGHNPGLYETILELVSPAQENDLFKELLIKFPTGSFAIVECEMDSWSELKKFTGKLVHFTRPRDLDPSLAPGS